MARSGLTKKENINVTIREIDFVSRFAKNFEALKQIMGITRPIKKEAGSKLVAKTAEVTLENGNVGEGEQIPYSLAQVHEVELGTITIEKYAKAVSIEAVDKYGADVAVTKTDDEFLVQLQNKVTDRFYTFLGQGTMISYESTFQLALAMAKGNVLNLWKAMNKDVTEIVAFVNVTDFYRYIGTADITVQTAFGMEYVKDFMGYRTIFLMDDTRVPRNKVYATPMENIVAYYIDPASSDFAKLGLNYTVDGETNLIGFHVEGNYGTAVGENFAIMGLCIFAEYLNGIAVINVGTAPTATLEIAPTTGTVLNKAVSSFQSVEVKDNALKGKLKYVAGWTDFSGDPAEQNGYYIALTATGDSGATIKARHIGGKTGNWQTLDSDGIIVVHLNENSQAIEFEATTAGGDKIVKSVAISQLIKE